MPHSLRNVAVDPFAVYVELLTNGQPAVSTTVVDWEPRAVTVTVGWIIGVL